MAATRSIEVRARRNQGLKAMSLSIQLIDCQGQMLIQDAGRPQARLHACPVGGAADIYAYRSAQALIGNPSDAPAIECTLGRLAFEVLSDDPTQALALGFAGSAHECSVNGEAHPPWTSLRLYHGDRLELISNHRSLRSYLTFAADCDDIDHWMGSAATALSVARGGYLGRALQAGDRLSLQRPRQCPIRSLSWAAIPKPNSRIAVLPGPQIDHFTEADVRQFYRQSWRISANSDRRGIRLEGPPLSGPISAGLISEPVIPGAVQILPDGQPLILMQDGPTTGGYPKIGQLSQASLARLAQKAPGAMIRCEAQTVEHARLHWQKWQQQLESLSSATVACGQ